MKKLVFQAIWKIGEWMTAIIRRGKRPWVVVGSVAGTALGSSLGLITIWWLVPGIALGGLVGATILAALFPTPEEVTTLATDDGKPFSPGDIRGVFLLRWQNVNRITVLMERAFYTAADENAPWQHVQAQLALGVDPKIQVQETVPLKAVSEIRLENDGGFAELQVSFASGSRTRSCVLDFASPEERTQFLHQFADLDGCTMKSSRRPDSFFACTGVPLSLSVLLGGLLVGSVMLSNHWTENPPLPLPRTGKQDLLVSTLIWLGPIGALAVFAAPLLLVLLWFIYRIVKPTVSDVLTPVRPL